MAGILRGATSLLLLTPLCVHAGPVASDAELEQRGARIGNIQIDVDDVFENTTHLAAPYRIANDLHISTHDTTVQQQLLFHTGDAYDRRVLDETARMLRAQRYLNEASVEPVRYNEADNTVDVLVRVHDVWTLSPGLSFGRKGGENSTRVKFADTNFLGLGKELSLARSNDVDRTAWELGYVDPNVFGSWWRLAANYSSLSDGSEQALSLERPFYAMDTRWSAGFSAGDLTNDISRYSLGHVVERLQMQERKFEINGGFSEGLHDGWTTRYLGGFRYDAREFDALAAQPDASIPADRVVA
jgi:outer membrane protein assembly factor BamA